MTKYLARSVAVLEETERFEGIMQVQLFTMEQNMRLYGYNPDISWKPGDPIYPDPRGVYRYENEDLEGYYGNHPRPIFQLINEADHYRLMACEDCGVTSNEDNCWFCGKEYPRIGKGQTEWVRRMFAMGPLSLQPDSYTEFDAMLSREVLAQQQRVFTEMYQGFASDFETLSRTARRFGQSLRGSRPLFSFLDEAFNEPVEVPKIDIPRPQDLGYVANPDRTPFEKPNVVGPMWGTAALWDPKAEPLQQSRPSIPSSWKKQSKASIPMPVMPELDFSDFQGPRFPNTPITQQRRTRR